MHSRKMIGLGAALAVAVAVWLVIGRSPEGGRADPQDVAQVARGERIYRDHCASCHGARLEGQPDWQVRRADGRMPAPPHDDTGHTWHHPDDALFQITRDGLAALLPGYQTDMPVYRDVLSDADIWAVLAYIKSQWPPAIQARQAEVSRRNQQTR